MTVPTDTPASSVAPLGFEHAPCVFTVPSGENVDCGYLTVPESRKQTNGPVIRLPVAVLKSPSNERRPDPIVYLDGGPGADTLETGSFLMPLYPASPIHCLSLISRGRSSSLTAVRTQQLNYDHPNDVHC